MQVERPRVADNAPSVIAFTVMRALSLQQRLLKEAFVCSQGQKILAAWDVRVHTAYSMAELPPLSCIFLLFRKAGSI